MVMEFASGGALFSLIERQGQLRVPFFRALAFLCLCAGREHLVSRLEAPSVDELEQMEQEAKAKGVPVYMGYNRNFSKYVRLANDFMKSKAKLCLRAAPSRVKAGV